MTNKLSKNAEKSGIGLVVGAAAVMAAKAAVAQGILPSDMQSEATVVLSGALLGMLNFVKYNVRTAIERRRARRK